MTFIVRFFMESDEYNEPNESNESNEHNAIV